MKCTYMDLLLVFHSCQKIEITLYIKKLNESTLLIFYGKICQVLAIQKHNEGSGILDLEIMSNALRNQVYKFAM